jgi:hypothetical protein
MNNDDLIDAIDIVRDALMTDEEEEQFQRIIDRLEGYELAYEIVLSENERLTDELNQLYFIQENILKERNSYRRLYLRYVKENEELKLK